MEAPLKTVNIQAYMTRMSYQTGGHLNYIIKNMLHNFQSTTISFLNVYSQEWQNVQPFRKYYEIFYIFTRLKNKFARESLHIYLNKSTEAKHKHRQVAIFIFYMKGLTTHVRRLCYIGFSTITQYQAHFHWGMILHTHQKV